MHAEEPTTVPQVEPPLLLERIAAGDSKAVDLCLSKFGALVWTLARKYCSSHADAEDATQDIFLQVWQNASRYDRNLGTEATFIATIARRKLIDRIRRRNQLDKMDTAEPDEHYTDLRRPEKLTDPLEQQDESRKAMLCFEKLSQEQRQVLSLSIQHGRSHSRIAEELQIPLGTIKSFARRGLIQLRACMQRRFAEGGIA